MDKSIHQVQGETQLGGTNFAECIIGAWDVQTNQL